MTKRRQTEIAFGSDAFLDVIANIVGILIILIVVAGVKVGRAPIPAPAQQPAAIAHTEPQPTPADPAELPAPLFPVAEVPLVPEPVPADPLPAPVSPEEFASLFPTDYGPAWENVAGGPKPETAVDVPDELPPLPTLQQSPPPPELLTEYVDLKAEVGDLKLHLTSVAEEVSLEETRTTDVTKSLEAIKIQAEAAVAALHQHKAQLAEVESVVNERKKRLSLLAEALDSHQQVKPEVQKLEHQLTPVGQSVEGEEIHFRLEGNRVSFVPMMELATIVKADMERHKEILLSRSYYKGTVGPRNGYRMEYLVQREAKTLAEEFRNGNGLVRILVTQWIIVPDKSLETETLEEALQSESRFISALRQARGKATITLWVYPDSFSLHQQLKEAIHEAGLAVASRPLPINVPIAGSPDGTKSISQ